MKGRIRKLIKYFCIAIAASLMYYAFYSATAIGLKCPLHVLTGFLCPCCGMTRMLASLLRLDFRSALYYNGALFVLLPVLLTCLGASLYGYVKTGNGKMKKWQRLLLCFCAAVLLIFGVMRNIFPLGLEPTGNIFDFLLDNI